MLHQVPFALREEGVEVRVRSVLTVFKFPSLKLKVALGMSE